MASTPKPVPSLREYKHWNQVPPENWRWPNFSPQEIACRGTGKIRVNAQALDKLQHLRTKLGKPLILNSAYRSPEHNAKVKGAKNSRHMQGDAFDVSMTNQNPVEFLAAAKEVGFTGLGFYPEARNNFIHIDTGPARTWGDFTPFRKRVAESSTPTFTPEPAPPTVKESAFKPEVLVPVGTAIGASGIAPVLSSQSPVAWAVGLVIIIAVVGFIGYRLIQGRTARTGD